MFRVPPATLTDIITVAVTVQTGLGETVEEGTPTPARVTTTEKWLADGSGAVIQTVTEIVTNTPIPIGATILLPSGETVEAKTCAPVRHYRAVVCYETKAW